jgi:hypothetical protein
MASPKKPTEKKKVGRPLEYTKEMGDLICELVASHAVGLMRLTKMYPQLPAKETINRWRYRVPAFRIQYAQAKIDQADFLAEECLEIADDDTHDVKINPDTGEEYCNTEFIARARLRVDTRKWLASKLLPKQYGQQAEDKKEEDKSVISMLIDKLAE